jgi:hypothetical protein
VRACYCDIRGIRSCRERSQTTGSRLMVGVVEFFAFHGRSRKVDKTAAWGKSWTGEKLPVLERVLNHLSGSQALGPSISVTLYSPIVTD